MPGNVKMERMTTANGSDLRQLLIQYNASVLDDQSAALAGAISCVWSFSSVVTASLRVMGRGSTDTNIGTGAFRFIITGQAASEAKAAVAAGTAPTAQTVPADTWAVYALDVATGGTISVSAGAANATTGYATEAAALAAQPALITAKARIGVVTVKTKAATAWVGATDALAGGASGNPASVTNYYPNEGCFAPTGLAVGPNGVVTCGGAGVQGGAVAVGTGRAWTAGRNGVLSGTTLSRGSTDTNLATTAVTYNAGGALDINKAAVAAGTAFGSLGTVPASKWAVIACLIDGTGAITFLSGPDNYGNGYGSELLARNATYSMYPAANLCMLGYITLQASSSTWIAGTDALAGGASGHPASATNYYSTAAFVIQSGNLSSQIANEIGTVFTSVNY